ncbi:MAG TPA: fumarylacetoacetate hydrolase family protein [Chitinophagaceae bacterium]|jgi:2-keto-4-pentenoate hydratase/2-oxohepta-3-ene-1,7-dioic acid hydratase in catechol pathway|nr:fumarylacetoacetate hydrolase family protein [Chitinophagaceae bacterium]
MKLIRFRSQGTIRPGILDGDQYFDVSSVTGDFTGSFFEGGGIERLQASKDQWQLLQEAPELDCPVANPSKIVCIGLNYADHARETGAALPPEPVVFLKSTTAITGPNDPIMIPRNSTKTDWEVELAVVIGKRASYVEEAEALDYVAGYCLHNDVSERAFQLERNGTWDKGKGCDSFAPLGPFLATKEEIGNVDNLRLWLTVNGKMMQDSSTRELIFKIPFLVAYVSQFMTLLPGDIISTGTPAGVGLGMNPQVYLQPGDVVELGIDGLGTARQEVIAFRK